MRFAGTLLARAWGAWNRFWFESNAPARMRLFRVLLGGLLFVFYLIRSLDLEFYFSENGMLPLSVMNEVMPMRFRVSVLNYVTGVGALWAVHAVFVLSLLGLAAGWRPRLMAGIAFVLHVSFMHRNMASIFGIDLIATFYLLYLSFADYRTRAGEGGDSVRAALGSVAFRLCQLQVCIIYAYSGLEKFKGSHWWRGEAIWDVMANAQLARWDFSWLSAFPLVVVLATYTTLAWEVYFPVLVWIRPLRYPVLLLGVMIHTGIALAVSIPFFGAIMIFSYSTFLDEELAASIESRFKRLLRRPVPALSEPKKV